MNRLNLSLLAVLLSCALWVVYLTNQQRHIFIELGRAQTQERALQQDWSQLQYQQSALSKTSRIENIAVKRLKMQIATLDRTQYITVAPASMPVAVTSTPSAIGGMSKGLPARCRALSPTGVTCFPWDGSARSAQ